MSLGFGAPCVERERNAKRLKKSEGTRRRTQINVLMDEGNKLYMVSEDEDEEARTLVSPVSQ